MLIKLMCFVIKGLCKLNMSETEKTNSESINVLYRNIRRLTCCSILRDAGVHCPRTFGESRIYEDR